VSLAIVLAQSGGIERAVSGAAGVPVAFFVGVVSFFTPCILPLLPGYLAYVSGVSGEELESGAKRSRVLAGTLLFTLGFALIYTALGATASAVGGFFLDRLPLIERAAGVFVIVMGVAFLLSASTKRLIAVSERPGATGAAARGGLVLARIVGQERGHGVRASPGVLGALPLGAAFAVTWVPCVGPGLAVILTLASSEGSAARGALLLFSFSLGFGVWFVLGGLAFRRATRAVAAIRRHLSVLTAIGGVFLIAIGVLLVTNKYANIIAPFRTWLNRFTPPI